MTSPTLDFIKTVWDTSNPSQELITECGDLYEQICLVFQNEPIRSFRFVGPGASPDGRPQWLIDWLVNTHIDEGNYEPVQYIDGWALNVSRSCSMDRFFVWIEDPDGSDTGCHVLTTATQEEMQEYFHGMFTYVRETRDEDWYLQYPYQESELGS